MDYRQLGRSGLRVSTLTLGTMTIGGGGPSASVGAVDLDGARRQIDLCLDAGVNLIDTADVYSAGVSEELVGQALVGRRDRVLLATKARMPMGEGPNDAGLSRHHLIEGCEASLRRLRTDHIDLYQVHEWDGQTPLEETLDALDDARARRARCATSAARTTPAGSSSRRSGSPTACTCSASSASRSTTRCRRATPSTSWCRPRWTRGWGSSSGARWPAACCRASTAATPSREEGRHLTDWDEPPVRDQEQLYDIVDALVEIGEGHGVSAAQVALAYTLGKPGRDLARHRRAQGGAARRQPRGGRPRARSRRARAARRGQRAAAAVSLLAPGQDGVGPPERRPT